MEAMPEKKRRPEEKRRPEKERCPGEVRQGAMPGEKRPPGRIQTDAVPGKERPQGRMQPDAAPGRELLQQNAGLKVAPHKKRPDAAPDGTQLSDEGRPDAAPNETQLLNEGEPDAVPAGGRLAARLREETAELLALLPAARKAAAGGPAGGESALDGIARAAYRVLRIAENMDACAVLSAGAVKAEPICVTALAAAYVNGAAGVCRSAVFRPEWPREPLWSPGCARLFAAALGNLLANAVQYGGERPFVSVRTQKSSAHLLLTVADNGAGYTGAAETENGLGLTVVRQYAETFGGQLLVSSAPGWGTRFTLCLPLCAPGAANSSGAQGTPSMSGTAAPSGAWGTPSTPDTAAPSGAAGTPSALPLPPIPPDYMADRFSPLYIQLAPVCDLPL